MTDFSTTAADDLDLLLRYAQDARGQEGAFRSLVERYSRLLMGTAMRITARPELAVDATQNVFLAMGLKSAELAKKRVPCLGAWLHRAAVMESKRVLRDALRAERRHALIQETMAKLSDTASPTDILAAPSDAMLRKLDEAIDALGPQDREILLLHYFERLKFKEIAERLDIGADAAQKRSVRALERLSGLLRSSAAAGLVAAFAPTSSEAAQAAEEALAVKITTAMKAIQCGKAIVPPAVLKIIAMTNATKITLGTIAALIAILAVTVSAGFMIGERFHTPPPRTLAAISPPTTEPSVAKVPAPAQPVEPSPMADQSPAGKFLAEAVQLSTAIRALEIEAGTKQKKGEDYSEILKSRESLWNQGNAAADRLGKADFPKAKNLIEAVKAAKQLAKRSGAMNWLYLAWLRQDKAAALAAAQSGGFYGPLFECWGQLDVQEAMEQGIKASAGDQGKRNSYVGSAFQGALMADPAAAVQVLQDVDGDDQINLLKGMGYIHEWPSKMPAFLNAVDDIKDPSLRLEIIGEFASGWAQSEPSQAMAWFDSLKIEDPGVKSKLREPITVAAARAKERVKSNSSKQ